MQNNHIKVILIFLVLITAGIIVWDFASTRPGKGPANPWEYNVDEYSSLPDSALIKYNEVLNIRLEADSYAGISFHNERIYLAGLNFLQVITPEGKEIFRKTLPGIPRSLTVSGDKIYIAYSDMFECYDADGNWISSHDVFGENPVVTSIAVYENLIFIADAGNRRVLRYNSEGELLGMFEGKSETGQLHGFIIPSGCFDLTISPDGELWVVNPGKHALEHYSHEGRLLRYWESPSFNHDGFSGCCNPVHIALLPDGSFVTSEKGIFRMKVHKPYGDLHGFVAPPEVLELTALASDIAVSPEGLIYALDFNRNLVRVFEGKSQSDKN